jgi:hypothetical protein
LHLDATVFIRRKEGSMAGRIVILVGVALVLGPHDLATGMGGEVASLAPFPLATVHMEQNATEGDVEVVFEVDGGAEGLAKLSVTGPGGKTVIDFTASGPTGMGIRQFRLESPEPPDPERVKAAYPAGVYTFAGATSTGSKLEGKATLTHKLPRPARILRPTEDAGDVSPRDLEITWSPVEGMAGRILTLEQEESGESVTARLPGSTRKFVVPSGFLRPGTEYKIGLGTVADGGNASFVETTFTTAGGKD